MQNIIHFENVANTNAANVTMQTSTARPARTDNWYKARYAAYKAKNDAHLRKAYEYMRENGMTNAEIQKKTGDRRVSTLIGATPKELTMAKREHKNAERKAEMQRLRELGLNNTQIAERLGVSHSLVSITLGKCSEEEYKAILRKNIAKAHTARKLSPNFRGAGHWMCVAKEGRIREYGPIVDKMVKAKIPYRKISTVLGYSEDTLRMYRRKYLSEARTDT